MKNIIWFLHALKEAILKTGYSFIIPRANYAPWLNDEDFKTVWNKIKNKTLVDQYRCYELWSLVAQTRNVSGALLEIGVWQGGTGSIIAKSAERNNIQETTYFCDTFSGLVKASKHDQSYKGGEHSHTSIESVSTLLAQLNLKQVKILKGIFPDEVSKDFNEEKVRFCHIDVDVYQSALDIFEYVWPKMDSGAVMVFDDYGFSSCNGITKFVNQNKSREDLIFIHNLNGHAIFIKSNI